MFDIRLAIEEAKQTNVLNLAGNRLTSLPAEIGELTNLTQLDLDRNQLTSLPAEIGELTNLTQLDLAGNRLTSLPAEIGKLTNLTQLGLAENQLPSLPAEIGELTNLTQLSLNFNQLPSLPAEIGELSNLTQLYLAGNQLTSLPAEIGELTNLTQLSLPGNQLKSVPAEIAKLTKLTQLYLAENQLTSLPEQIWELSNLTRLDLDRNQLKSVPAEIAKLSNLMTLNLNDNQLKSLPAEIGKLSNLENLYVVGNELTSLPTEISKLSNLRELSLGNQLTSLPAEIGKLSNLTKLGLGQRLTNVPAEIGKLSNLMLLYLNANQLTSLPEEIWELSNLTELHLHSNQLTGLAAEIGRLSKLTKLNLDNNQLTSLPAEIGELSNLTELHLHSNQLTGLAAEIGRLSKLTRLHLGGNRLTSLPAEIGKLTNLTQLYLGGNQLTSLPAEIGKLTNLTQLTLNDNQLPIPPEILKKTRSPKEILDYYLQISTAPTRPLNEAKLLVVGEASVGKTSLIKRLLGKEFDAQENMTEGIERHEWQMRSGDGAIRLNVWDFGGQEIMHATHQFFLTKRSLYLLVIDSRQNERQSRISYWLRVIESFGEDSPVIVVCNKCDQRRVELDWKRLRAKHGNLRDIAMAVSCADPPQGITDLRAQIEREVGSLDHVRDPFPEKWFTIKTRLEDMQGNYLPYETYKQMCGSQGVEDEGDQRRLIDFLHDLGIVLHFHEHPILQAENILDPDWVTKGVYSIVTRDELKGKGVLQFDQLSELLHAEQYPTAMHQQFIVEMMRKFELCFDFEGQTNQKFLIPGLLPIEKPEVGDWSDSLKFQYRYEVLPDSVIARFIVRMHTFIDGETYWRTGVVLASQDGGNRALIEADLEDGVIFISLMGNGEGRRRFLDVVRAGFHGIHASIPGIKAREFVPIPSHPSHVVSYRRLCKLEERQIAKDYVEEIDEEIVVTDLLDGVSHAANRYPEPTVEVFYSYSHKDEELRDEVNNHLSILSRQGAIKGWHDRKITAGEEWGGKIDSNLERADLILLLVSSDFLASDYCYDIEMKRAMQRHEAGEAVVVPVILRACDWNGAPFGKLQALPRDAKPVTSWGIIDEAFTDVAKGIRKAVDGLQAKRQETA